jgi:hypothetical protein
MSTSPTLELTWAGFDAAVDLIAAQCRRRDRSGVHAASVDGEALAERLAAQLGLNVLELPTPGMLLVDAHVTPELIEKAACWSDVEAWVWVDTSPGGRWPSVVKVAGRAALRFPWRREFLAGFDD